MEEPHRPKEPLAWINGAAASHDAAARHAAQLLAGAKRPLVTGLGGVSTEAQRIAVGIADHLRGAADWSTSPADQSAVLALQTVGGTAASWGEAAQRTDLIVCWRCAPHPALASADAYRVLVGGATVGGAAEEVAGVDEQIVISDGADYEAIAVLRAMVAKVEVDPARVRQATGADHSALQALAERLQASNYAVIVRGPQLAAQGAASMAALTCLAQELHQSTRAVTLSPPADGNRLGAENVLAWQTGFPLGVDFARGYPRYGPSEFTTAQLLQRKEIDAALVVCQAEMARLASLASTNLRSLPRVVLTAQADPPTDADVVFRVASLHEGGGTYYRNDGLALPVGAATASGGPAANAAPTANATPPASIGPTAHDVLISIRDCLVSP